MKTRIIKSWSYCTQCELYIVQTSDNDWHTYKGIGVAASLEEAKLMSNSPASIRKPIEVIEYNDTIESYDYDLKNYDCTIRIISTYVKEFDSIVYLVYFSEDDFDTSSIIGTSDSAKKAKILASNYLKISLRE